METNCIERTRDKRLEGFTHKSLSWKDLHDASFVFDEPFELRMQDGQVIQIESVVRIIPKKRMVAFGQWLGRPIVAKLFFDAQHARRHMNKDKEGILILQQSKIPTPALYYEGVSEDRRIYTLLLERKFNAVSLESVWLNKTTVTEVLPQLRAMILELATQHVLGVLQHDLHLKNFLLTDKVIYTLDGSDIERFPGFLLSKKVSIKNLALFFSQLGVTAEPYIESLLRYYAKTRGWLLKQEDFFAVMYLVKTFNQKRWQRYNKKIFRECTQFASVQDWRTKGMYDRAFAGPQFVHFLKNPETVFSLSHATILKAGRSATVIRVRLDNQDFVIKRYNMKSLWHRMRRTFRKTRAHASWRLAQKLKLFGVSTANPVAFVEKRFFGFRGQSYYVTEYVMNGHAGEYFSQNETQAEKVDEMVQQIVTLLKDITKLNMTHGDLKITNILVDQQEKPVLIDLDGVSEHTTVTGLRNAWRKEVKRFLRNFENMPNILHKFKERL